MGESQEGGCLCGRLRYSVANTPIRVTFCNWFCQPATGAAYMVEPIFRRSDVQIAIGRPALYRHRSTGSNKLVEVHFCSDRGTNILLSFERFPDIFGLCGGT